jgi:two-component system chemotaxis sensor kinase CheA
MNELNQAVREFVIETAENLDQLDRDLVELEKRPNAREELARIFRTIHSVKGATGFLGFSKLGALAHAGEGLLNRLREGVLVLNGEITSALLELVDRIRRVLSTIDRDGVEGELDSSDLIEKLTRLQKSSGAGDSPSAPPRTETRKSAASSKPGLPAKPTPSAAGGDAIALPNQPEATQLNSPGGTIRVDVKQLDKLMNLVGELVLTRNELVQFASVDEKAVPPGTSQRLNAITTELQDEVMKVRMQPIDSVWSKFPRLVRDLALRAGKKVRLDIQGKETELDKTLIEAITDPLTHLVRNAVDHGLENPTVRMAAGKPAEGRLVLRASHEGGQVHIEISDDGAGIDVHRVKAKAMEHGLISPEQSRLISDPEAVNLIFLPGFSTAEAVTDISGRGVGMDVVKTNIEKIGGEVSVESQLSLGTTVKIKIPLTLAIMPALVVRSGGQRYAIPQSSILQLVRLEGDDVRRKIERIQNASVYRLREQLLPVVWLSAELAQKSPIENAKGREGNAPATIIFLEAGERSFGLVVDEVNDTQEIVVKPLGKHLRGAAVFAGATILGDGKVVLIVDVFGLALRAHVVSESRELETPERKASSTESAPQETETLLLFTGRHDSQMAVPLSQVARLEEFPSASLEETANFKLVQYRDGILPLVEISDLLPERRSRPRVPEGAARASDTVQAIVHTRDGRSVGLLVEQILDTIEHSALDRLPASRKGVAASAVIGGRITEILDLATLSIDLRDEIPTETRV